jgi:hypothetical protein
MGRGDKEERTKREGAIEILKRKKGNPEGRGCSYHLGNAWIDHGHGAKQIYGSGVSYPPPSCAPKCRAAPTKNLDKEKQLSQPIGLLELKGE